jgi:uncharacterized membrane protein SirB2
MSYLLLRHLHITCVVITGCGFLLRGFWMVTESPQLNRRWVKVAPHVIDTVLLASAIALVVLTHQLPWEQSWVLAKILGLLAYIGFGMVALRRGRTKSLRLATWLAALGSFAYIVSVALTRSPLGFLAPLLQ